MLPSPGTKSDTCADTTLDGRSAPERRHRQVRRTSPGKNHGRGRASPRIRTAAVTPTVMSSTRGWKCAVGVDLRAVGYQSPMGALLPRVRLAGRRSTIVVAALGSAGVLALAACGGGDDSTGLGVPDGAPPELTAQRAEWPAPNGDLQNTRVATSSEISAANVATLGIAWRAPITAKGTFGGYASTPIISDGVVYTQDLSSNVAAYSLESGKELWKRSYDSPTVGPTGSPSATARFSELPRTPRSHSMRDQARRCGGHSG